MVLSNSKIKKNSNSNQYHFNKLIPELLFNASSSIDLSKQLS